MGLPSTANWGASGEKVPRPSGPNAAGPAWFQELVDKAPAGSVLKPPPAFMRGPCRRRQAADHRRQQRRDDRRQWRGTVFIMDGGDSALRDIRLTNLGVAHDTGTMPA